MKEDYFGQLDDYDEPFYEQQYTHGSVLFVCFFLDQINPPKLPQTLDITQLWYCGNNFYYTTDIVSCERKNLTKLKALLT